MGLAINSDEAQGIVLEMLAYIDQWIDGEKSPGRSYGVAAEGAYLNRMEAIRRLRSDLSLQFESRHKGD